MKPLITIPLFPLKLVLFPGGILPLKIFEKRYVDMVRSCLRDKSGFAIVSVHEDIAQANYPFSAIGTLVDIIETDVPQPGLFNIKCMGLQKISVKSASQKEDGLWLADVDRIPNEIDIQVPEDLLAPKHYFEQLITSLAQENITSNEMPFSTPFQLDSGVWLANRWCEILDLPITEKQRMLEIESPLLRLSYINALLTSNHKNLEG